MTHPPRPDQQPPPRRRALQLEAPRTRARRSPRAVAASLAAHAVVLWVVAQALDVPRHVGALLERRPPPAEERLTWVEPAVGGGGAPGGLPVPEPAAPATRPRAVAPPAPVAPAVTPTGIPPVDPQAAPAAASGAAVGSGDGTGVGRPGPAAGLRPTYTDSPVWTAPDAAPRELPSVAKRIDAMIAEDFAELRDSVAADEAARRRSKDWTIERDGRKYGIDERYIHLGRLTIPTPLLGLLNIADVQANPIQAQRARSYGEMARQSREQGWRLENEKDFRDVVRDIRERKDRERAERMAREAEARRQQPAEPPPS